MFLSGQASFCRLVSLGSEDCTSNNASKILWRLDLHLGGSACIAVAAESPVRGQESEARGQIGKGIVRCNP